MSHHEACESSATATRSQRRLQREKHRAARCSYIKPRAPSRHVDVRTLLSLLVIIISWTSLLGAASAQKTHGDRQRSASLSTDDLDPAWKGPSLLVVDTRPPPVAPLFMHLQRRDNDPTKAKSSASRTATLTTATSAVPSDSDFTAPSPFDTSLSNNFTSPCAQFFRRMLSDQNFVDCHPFSLLLQTSSGFFDASKSFTRITQTLEATCSATQSTCQNVMNGYALQLRGDSSCAVDYANDNPQVLQAYNGLLAYSPLYQASCLQDDGGNYCYANAVTNTTGITDSYPYYLPLGVSLPGGARPTCNTCLQNVMAIFSSVAGNSSQPVSKTYNAAAQQIDLYCGPTFVNKTATPLKGAASIITASVTPTIALFIMLLLYVFN